MSKHESRFDFSNYSPDHPNFDLSNKLVPGKFKDEMGGKLIEEFVGLRSKMYSKGGVKDPSKTGSYRAIAWASLRLQLFDSCCEVTD